MKKMVVLGYLLSSLIFVLLMPSIGYSNQEAKDVYEQKPTKIETETNVQSDFLEIYYTYFSSSNQNQDKNQEDVKDANERAKIKTFLKNKEVLNYEFYGELICNYFDNWDDRKLFASILVIESHGKTRAKSKKGARGPWQIMPFWKAVLKIPGSLYNPEVNIKYAEKVLDIHTYEANGKLWGHKGGLYRYSGKSKHYAKKIHKLMNEIEKAWQLLLISTQVCRNTKRARSRALLIF